MVSYTDLSPIKQPAVPVAVGLNDPLPEQLPSPVRAKSRKDSGAPGSRGPAERSDPDEWRRGWEQMHSKILYFKGVTEDALPELQRLFKTYRGIRLNVDPHESLEITGNVEFRNIYDTERAMVVLNNMRLQKDAGTLIMSPLSNAELGPPLNGGYICIKHIPDDATELSLYDLLRPSGPLYSCSFPTTASGQRKGMAHACYVDLAYANAAIEQLNFSEYQGNTISMQLSRPPRQSRASTTGSSHSRDSNGAPKPSATAPTVQTQQPRSNTQAVESETRGGDCTAPAPQTFSSPTRPSPHSPSSASAISGTHQQQQQQQQPGRGATSPTGAVDGPGSGLGGVIVPGKLFVTNLHPTVSHKELFALFKKYGYIQSARVSIDPATKKSRGHAIVQFSDPTAALDALKECQGADIKGRKITMYQYEHVNKNMPPSLSPRAASSAHEYDASQANSAPLLSAAASESATESAVEVPIMAIQANSVPFPRSNSVASSHLADPLLDPVMMRNLSDTSRTEILTQKLISEIASNPAVDVRDASRIVDSFIKRPLEDVLALLSDPGLLASEWDLEQRASLLMPYSSSTGASASQGSSPTKQSAGPSSQTARDTIGVLSSQMYKVSVSSNYGDDNEGQPEARRNESGGIRVQDYNTETEEYIELLLSKPDNERKKKLGSKLFPLIKGMGYKESTKLTVWILDHMSHDVRTMAYTLNDSAKLRDIVNEAQQSLGVPKTSEKGYLFLAEEYLDTDDKHILSGLFDMERVAKMKSSRLIPRLCQEAYCAGPPHRITTTIGEKKQACLQALRGANKSATRVAQITSLGFICSMFVQHRTPIIHWLLGAVAVQPSQCQKCGGTISCDHAADCIGAKAKLSPIIANAIRKLRGQQMQRLQQANAIDAALMALNKNDMASAIKIALVIDKIYTQCLGRRSPIKQLTPRVLE